MTQSIVCVCMLTSLRLASQLECRQLHRQGFARIGRQQLEQCWWCHPRRRLHRRHRFDVLGFVGGHQLLLLQQAATRQRRPVHVQRRTIWNDRRRHGQQDPAHWQGHLPDVLRETLWQHGHGHADQDDHAGGAQSQQWPGESFQQQQEDTQPDLAQWQRSIPTGLDRSEQQQQPDGDHHRADGQLPGEHYAEEGAEFGRKGKHNNNIEHFFISSSSFIIVE